MVFSSNFTAQAIFGGIKLKCHSYKYIISVSRCHNELIENISSYYVILPAQWQREHQRQQQMWQLLPDWDQSPT